MKKRILYLMLIIVICVSCNKTGNKDYSLSEEEYTKLGIPESNKIWSLNDYSKAFQFLLKLKYDKPFTLPIKDSKKSKKLFNRMVNVENMSYLKNDSIPLYEKAQLLKQYLQVQGELIDLYTNVRMKKQYYNRELVDIYIYGMQVTQKMLKLANEINNSDDPGDIMMQSGYQAIQMLHFSTIIDALNEQKNTSKYFENDLKVLSDSIVDPILKNRDWIINDSSATNNLKQALILVLDSTSSEYIKNKYSMLMERL